jgi:hypothetical protein
MGHRCLCGKDTDVFVEKDTEDSSSVTGKSTKCSSERKIASQKRPDDVDGTQMIASPSNDKVSFVKGQTTSDEAMFSLNGSTFHKRRCKPGSASHGSY